MKLNCNIADDLFPLYLEDMCSEDSRAALEEHLRECPACREKLARMKNNDVIPQANKQESNFPIADYAKKVKRHRIRVGLLIALMSAVAACILALCFLAISDMHRQANPTIYHVEAGVYDLTAAKLETTAAEVGKYILFTNTQRIQVSIPKGAEFDGEILLWNTTDKDTPILHSHADSRNNTCVFSGLSATQRYMVTCGEGEEIAVTVSDGRVVNFWYSLRNVLKEIIGR